MWCSAACAVIQRLNKKAPAAIAQEIYITLCAYRVAKRHEHFKYNQFSGRYTALQQFQDGVETKYDDLHDFLANKIRLQAEQLLEELSTPTAVQKSSVGLIRWLRLWAVKSKRFGAITILDQGWNVPADQKESVANLLQVLGPSFFPQSLQLCPCVFVYKVC
jgi:hypothetical protein